MARLRHLQVADADLAAVVADAGVAKAAAMGRDEVTVRLPRKLQQVDLRPAVADAQPAVAVDVDRRLLLRRVSQAFRAMCPSKT